MKKKQRYSIDSDRYNLIKAWVEPRNSIIDLRSENKWVCVLLDNGIWVKIK